VLGAMTEEVLWTAAREDDLLPAYTTLDVVEIAKDEDGVLLITITLESVEPATLNDVVVVCPSPTLLGNENDGEPESACDDSAGVLDAVRLIMSLDDVVIRLDDAERDELVELELVETERDMVELIPEVEVNTGDEDVTSALATEELWELCPALGEVVESVLDIDKLGELILESTLVLVLNARELDATKDEVTSTLAVEDPGTTILELRLALVLVGRVLETVEDDEVLAPVEDGEMLAPAEELDVLTLERMTVLVLDIRELEAVEDDGMFTPEEVV